MIIYSKQIKPAIPEDIVVGNIILYPYDGFIAVVETVLKPSDLWKGYSAKDGCRYGLDGAYVINQ